VVGRDPDLTGRTHIWSIVLSTGTNPLVGTGYESFWLGPRLEWVWEQAGTINEAHNGFLEVYLNLGLIGVFLLVGFLIGSYRTISRQLRSFSSLSSLSVALWTVLLFYNATESAFRGHLMWVAFLLGVITLPPRPMASRTVSGFAPAEARTRQIR
jgi:O-antigen ligase